MGAAVNLAARLMAICARTELSAEHIASRDCWAIRSYTLAETAGHAEQQLSYRPVVLVDDATARASRYDIEYAALPARRLKGFREPLPLFLPCRWVPKPPLFQPRNGSHFVGKAHNAALAALRGMLPNPTDKAVGAEHREARTLVITGATGLGKHAVGTSLAQDVAPSQGFVVACGTPQTSFNGNMLHDAELQYSSKFAAWRGAVLSMLHTVYSRGLVQLDGPDINPPVYKSGATIAEPGRTPRQLPACRTRAYAPA